MATTWERRGKVRGPPPPQLLWQSCGTRCPGCRCPGAHRPAGQTETLHLCHGGELILGGEQEKCFQQAALDG